MTVIDPALLHPAAADPETLAIARDLEARLAGAPSMHTLPVPLIRAARESGQSLWGPIVRRADAVEETIAGPGGPLVLRILAPANPRGVYLHFHGGGYALGAAHHADVRNGAIADQLGIAVVSVEYRLAPEHPWPAAYEDAEAAALWLVTHGPSRFGTDRYAVGGDSAGATLALAALLRLRDRHGLAGAFRAANLVYGVYDMRLTPGARNWGPRNLVLSTPIMAWFVAMFVPDPAMRDTPEASPILADLAGMPECLLSVGTLDPLLEDTLNLHARLAIAGVKTDLRVEPGAVHGFNALGGAAAGRANAAIDAFLARTIG